MKIFNKKAKKLKANSVLAAFMFGVTFFSLCAFGADMAFIVLSRYKLQKITDYIALEYASVKMSDMEQGANTDKMAENCEDVKRKYLNIYNVAGSGILNFKIDTMRYKSNPAKKEVVVKIQAISTVQPIFLRFVGVGLVVVHANSYAKSQAITVDGHFEADSMGDDVNITAQELYNNGIDISKRSFLFSPPFTQTVDGELRTADLITTKATGLGDFRISISTDVDNPGTGYFIFGGQKVGDSVRWFDMGNLITEGTTKRVCLDSTHNTLEYETSSTPDTSKCFYCVPSVGDNSSMDFNLGKQIVANQEGASGRIDRILLYQAISPTTPEVVDGETTYKDPCDPSIMNASEYYTAQASNIDFNLTILNNVLRINKSEFDNFYADTPDVGFCPNMGVENGF